MEGLFQFLTYIVENYGIVTTMSLSIIALIISGLYFIVKTFPDIIKENIQTKLVEIYQNHSKGTKKRKNISPTIQKALGELLIEANGDRALLLEFSNGTSNLAGLPFLFLNATSESLSAGTSSVAHLYQRINISLFADMINELEETSFIYISDIETIKDTNPIVYNFVKPNGVKSMIFYSIYGLNDTLGFIVVTSTKKYFNRCAVLPKMAEKAQVISSLLNLDELDDTIK